MSEPFVADSSVGVGWIHPSQSNVLTHQLLEEAKSGIPVHVPSLWHLEISNALLVFVRRKLMTDPQRSVGLALLSQLRVMTDGETHRLAFSTIAELAEKYSLSVYDAAYLELSRRKSLPLATCDEALKNAARKAGIRLR